MSSGAIDPTLDVDNAGVPAGRLGGEISLIDGSFGSDDPGAGAVGAEGLSADVAAPVAFTKNDFQVLSSDICVVPVLGPDLHAMGAVGNAWIHADSDLPVQEDPKDPTPRVLVTGHADRSIGPEPNEPLETKRVVVVLVIQEDRLPAFQDQIRHETASKNDQKNPLQSLSLVLWITQDR